MVNAKKLTNDYYFFVYFLAALFRKCNSFNGKKLNKLVDLF